jgi:Protein of unknown function (DUF2938)
MPKGKRMEEAMDLVWSVALIGIGATAVTDLWAVARKRLFGIAPPDFGLVGRWLAHMLQARFRHDSIAAAPRVRGERAIGWIAHYVIGISFAAVLIGVRGVEWLERPSLGPALAMGIVTVAAPYFVMQPGMGAGIAASRTPRPAATRINSLVTHAIFGFGLYAAGWLLAATE